MRIISYNVNGIRAAVKKGFLQWLEQESPDVLCLQETKAQDDQLPTEELNRLGYQVYHHAAQKKGYSGVAIFCRQKPDEVVYGMGNAKYDSEGRFIRVDFGSLSVVSVYHPSGSSGDVRQAFKMEWLDDYQKYVLELRKQRPELVLSGDYNICHKPIDIHDPVRNANSSGFLPEEREWMSGFLNTGFIDTFREFHPEPHQYTWWSYRAGARGKNKGWRIDYHMVTENMKANLKDAGILADVVHSDHCPLFLEIK